MTLPAVLLATQATLQGLKRVDENGDPWLDANGDQMPLFDGLSLGPIDSVPTSPWGVLQMSTFSQPQQEGSEREITDWNLTLRMMVQYAPDHYVAEMVLANLIEVVKDGFRAHIKQGLASIERTKVLSGSMLYLVMNDVTFRFCDLTIGVREKINVRYAA